MKALCSTENLDSSKSLYVYQNASYVHQTFIVTCSIYFIQGFTNTVVQSTYICSSQW